MTKQSVHVQSGCRYQKWIFWWLWFRNSFLTSSPSSLCRTSARFMMHVILISLSGALRAAIGPARLRRQHEEPRLSRGTVCIGVLRRRESAFQLESLSLGSGTFWEVHSSLLCSALSLRCQGSIAHRRHRSDTKAFNGAKRRLSLHSSALETSRSRVVQWKALLQSLLSDSWWPPFSEPLIYF